ncbi:MAG: PLDc N-terminal domain-containing protein [Lachnospiraceae bacterium]|nr:PLDc N-terminal domain-containing protein [Lachnospiraceae bacterium]
MEKLKEFLPFLIPFIIAELVLFGYTLYHVLTHNNYKRGNRTIWLIVTIVGMNFVGPVLYFLLGKEEV